MSAERPCDLSTFQRLTRQSFRVAAVGAIIAAGTGYDTFVTQADDSTQRVAAAHEEIDRQYPSIWTADAIREARKINFEVPKAVSEYLMSGEFGKARDMISVIESVRAVVVYEDIRDQSYKDLLAQKTPWYDKFLRPAVTNLGFIAGVWSVLGGAGIGMVGLARQRRLRKHEALVV